MKLFLSLSIVPIAIASFLFGRHAVPVPNIVKGPIVLNDEVKSSTTTQVAASTAAKRLAIVPPPQKVVVVKPLAPKPPVKKKVTQAPVFAPVKKSTILTASSTPVQPAPAPSVPESAPIGVTTTGVRDATNVEREKNGALPLKANNTLNAIAAARLQDMFDRHYFAHVSPIGEDAVSLAEMYGYDYNYIGENIALGNFASGQTMVTAWMNSPGHRANMVNKNYTEIGVAVGKGIFNGREQWIGVQIFGKALSG